MVRTLGIVLYFVAVLVLARSSTTTTTTSTLSLGHVTTIDKANYFLDTGCI
jgi:hypothetical protein